MTRTDLLLLIIGLLLGFSLSLLLFMVGSVIVGKRSDDEEERLYLERKGEQREMNPGFVHSQRHTSWWNQ